MAQTKVYSIKIDGVDTAVNNINDLENGIRTLDEKLKGTQIGTDEFSKLQKEIAKSKSQLKDFELQVEGLDKEQRATALVDTFNGLAGGVQAVSSAFIAFGVESEAIEGAERKLLGVIGVVSGLKEASNGVLQAQKLLSASNITLGKSFTTAFKAGTTGTKALKVGLISTGIGALIVAVGLLIAYWDDLVEAIGLGASEGQKNLEIAEATTAEAQSQLDITNQSTELLKQQGMTDGEILQLKIDQTKAVIEGLKAQLTAQETIKKEQVASAERSKTILAGILKFLTLPLALLLRSIDSLGKVFGKDYGLEAAVYDSVADLVFSPEDVAEKGDETIAETKKQLLALENSVAGFENKQSAEAKANAEKARKDRIAQGLLTDKELADQQAKELQAIEDAEKAKRDLKLAQQKSTLDSLKVGYENQITELNIAQEKELADITLTEEAKKAIREKYDSEKLIALEEYNDAVIEENISTAQEIADKAKEITALDDEAKADKKADDEQIANERVQIANDSFNAIIALADAFGGESEAQQKKAFNIAKGAQLAQATMNGILGVQNAFTTAVASPLTTIFPAYPYIQAGLAGAFALANIKKISSSQYQSASAGDVASSGGGGGAGGGGMGGTSSNSLGAPRPVNEFESGTNRERSKSNTPAVKAYVLAGDVSSAQSAEEKINQRRTL